MQHIPVKAIVFLLCLVLAMGSAVPSHALFSEITIRDEIEMGQEFDQKLRQQIHMLDDPLVTDYVRDLVERIVAHMPNRLPYPVTTAVINNRTMNAFAVPGGYVYVFTGLILGLNNEDELAGVLCHEIAHVSERHVAKRMEDMELASLGAMLGMIGGALLGVYGKGSDSSAAAQALMIGSQAGAASAFLLYTQENEREADHVGMNYLLAAGFNPQGMPDTFNAILKNKWGGTSDLPSYLSTHPALSERVGYLEERIKRMPPDYLARQTDNTRFLRVQALLRGRMADPAMTLAEYLDKPEDQRACLDHMAAGMAAMRLNKNNEAQGYYQKALACGSNDSLVLREAGRFYFKEGDFEQAQPLLQKAMFLDPDDVLTLFYNARLLGERKEYAAAIENMRKVLKAYPDDAEVHYYLGRMLGESGDLFQAHLHLAYAAIFDHDMKQAEFHLEKARGLARTPEDQEKLEKLERLSKAAG